MGVWGVGFRHWCQSLICDSPESQMNAWKYNSLIIRGRVRTCIHVDWSLKKKKKLPVRAQSPASVILRSWFLVFSGISELSPRKRGKNYHLAICKKPDRWRHCLLCSTRNSTTPLLHVFSTSSQVSSCPRLFIITQCAFVRFMLLWHLDSEILRKKYHWQIQFFSARRWTGVVLKEKVLYHALPLHHVCVALFPILRWELIHSFTDVAAEHLLPATQCAAECCQRGTCFCAV